MECCKFAVKDDCSNFFCPNGQMCENTRNGPVCKCPIGFEKDLSLKHCIGNKNTLIYIL